MITNPVISAFRDRNHRVEATIQCDITGTIDRSPLLGLPERVTMIEAVDRFVFRVNYRCLEAGEWNG